MPVESQRAKAIFLEAVDKVVSIYAKLPEKDQNALRSIFAGKKAEELIPIQSS